MEIIKIKPQSLILFVGPANSGKSYFAENYLIPQLRAEFEGLNKIANIQHISSDNLRRELLGFNPFSDSKENMIFKTDNRMDSVSDMAFALLDLKVKLAMSYPVNADFVIIDTTGFNKEFREQMKKLAFENHYNFQPIIFDYKKREDYYAFAGISGSFGKKIISESVKRFREKQSELNKKIYPNQIKIKSNDFSNLKIEMENKESYNKYFLPNDGIEYLVIGDIHQSYDELKELIIKNDFIIDENDMINSVPESGIKFIKKLQADESKN